MRNCRAIAWVTSRRFRANWLTFWATISPAVRPAWGLNAPGTSPAWPGLRADALATAPGVLVEAGWLGTLRRLLGQKSAIKRKSRHAPPSRHHHHPPE